MAGPIARRPSGLLDLLLAQQQGRNPNALTDNVQPVIDLTPFYSADRLEATNTSFTATAVGSGNTITVPAGEVWALTSLGWSGTANAVDQQMRIAIRFLDIFEGIDQFFYASPDFKSIGATDVFSDGVLIPQPLFLNSGSKLSLRVEMFDKALGANIAIAWVAAYVRMDT